MGGDGLCRAGALEDEELGQDGDGFEVDREGPQGLERELDPVLCVVEDKGQERTWTEQVLQSERVQRRIVRCPGDDEWSETGRG